MKIGYLLLFIFGMTFSGHAGPAYYNLDVTRGLPSNHIYGMLIDRNGYLWLATPEGVVRYSGYEIRVFDVSDGLPINDVWELFEDQRGRIWILSFSQSLGYIDQDRYKEVYIPDSSLRILPHAHTIGNHRKGIYLHNSETEGKSTLLVEYNDTLYTLPGDVAFYRSLFAAAKDMYSLPLDEQAATLFLNRFERQVTGEVPFDKDYGWSWRFGNYVARYTPEQRKISICNVRDPACREISLPGESGIVKLLPGSSVKLNLLIDTFLYQIKPPFNGVSEQQGIDGIPVSSISWVTDGPPWGDCRATVGRGVFFELDSGSRFSKVSGDMSEYSEVGNDLNGNHYWWSRWSRQLITLSAHSNEVKHVWYKSMHHIRRIIPWTKRYSLVVASMNEPYLMDHQSGETKSFLREKKLFWLLDKYKINIHDLMRLDGFVLKDTTDLFILSRPHGLVRLDLRKSKLSYISSSVGRSARTAAYKDLVYDPLLRTVWAYGNAGLQVYKPEENDESVVHIRGQFLKGIDKVFFDEKYGNVFVKKLEGLFMLNRRTGIITMVGEGVNANKGVVVIHDDLLVIAARFGVTFYKITGSGRLSAPVIYNQVRNEYYSSVTGMQLIGKYLFINTNAGLMKCPIPDHRLFSSHNKPGNESIRLLVKSNEVRQAKSGDTILLQPGGRSLQFDVVNPSANGIPRYSYSLMETNDQWHKVGSNELVMPELTPGRYYTLRVQVADDAHRYKAMVHVYAVPLWWQTIWMKRMILLAGVLVLILLAWVTAWITRRIMIKENYKKNLRMEIELKAIYAQINPHFIYNTLNSVLGLIRMGNTNDAVYNVSKFSKLLRAYIKSSRNRYITVGEELENIKNYIELQQERFKGKFDYRIEVTDPSGEIADVRIPSLLIQPLVENAINHGLFHKEEGKGMLDIILEKKSAEKEIICIIEDNGIGRSASARINRMDIVKTESYGSLLIKELIDILNRYEQADIRLEYVDKQLPHTGTIVKLYIR